MRLLAIMILFVFIPTTLSEECCKDDLCSPSQIKPKHLYLHIDQETLLPKTRSGCYCKENPGKYIKCYGRVSCSGIPNDLNLTVPVFRISTSAINLIKKQDFLRYTSIEKVEIENNDNLQTIEEYSFEHLSRLVNMSISYNPNLKQLQAKTFIGLAKLRELHLLSNGFNSISDFSGALAVKYVPVLYNLVLKDNNFQTINSTDFAPMENSALKKLNIAQCRIEYISSRSLLAFKKLEELRIGVNQIDVKNLTNLIATMSKANILLKFLNLYKSGLRKSSSKELLEAIGNSSISCLSLAGNQFEIIDNNTFPVMKNIKLLDLRDVSAVDISKDAFRGMISLKTLLLADNKFINVPFGARLQNLIYLDIKANSKYHFSTSYFTILNHTFANMTRLKVLDLSYNTIQTLYEDTFFWLSEVKILSLKKCDIIFIGAGSFLPLKNLIFLDLQENKFALSSFKPMETDIFKGLENLHVLLLGNNNITFINNLTFYSLRSLTHLSLNDNKIIQLKYQYIKSMTVLNVLNVQRNSIRSWSTRLFSSNQNLTSLYLGNNRITNFTMAMLDDFANKSFVDLSDNNFICDCQLYHTFRAWFIRHNKKGLRALNLGNARCFPNEKPVNEFVISTKNDSACVENYIFIIASSLVICTLFIGTVAFMYYYRWHWRYYVFLTKLHLIRKGKSKPRNRKPGYCNYEYDAFVSYSNEDSSFVLRLVSMLENYEPFLKLCVYERDFKIGSFISESILENVTKSRKVLLIVSENYVKSQWCQWETHIAQHCNLFFRDGTGEFANDSLILIKLGPVNRKNLTPTLKYLLKTRIYLQWDKEENKQAVFWAKLRNNLASDRSEGPILTLTHL